MNPPLSATELGKRLDYLLGPVLSSRRGAAPLAEALAALDRTRQDFVLHWIEVIDRSNYELAYQFAAAAPAALGLLDAAAIDAWILHAMDVYDRDGLFRASEVFRQAEAFRRQAAATHAATFAEYAPVLELFVCGLAGRPLKLDLSDEAKTDTETLFLPPQIAVFPDKADNCAVYRILVTLLWAQLQHGGAHADLAAACSALPDPGRAARLLAYFEGLRLEARIAGQFPGIARAMERLRGTSPDARCAGLAATTATLDDSLSLLGSLYGHLDPPELPWRFTLHAGASAVRAARLARERGELASALAGLMRQQQTPESAAPAPERRFSVETRESGDGKPEFDLRLDGKPVAPTRQVTRLLESIRQDLGDIPGEYLQVADSGDGSAREDTGEPDPDGSAGRHETAAPVHFYDEWDHQRRHYRKNWCALRELDVEPGDGAFVNATLARYRPQILQLRRRFELLRGEDRVLRRQSVGDDIDFDALVEGYTDLRNGRELPDRLLTRRHRAERNLAALFMVDMSGSTKGWINDAERESLVMLCEALEVLGDRHAIYGFSGVTRKRCEIYRIKRFDEPYDDTVRRRIAGIRPRDYTRMGAAIRHLSKTLHTVDARTRLLVTLSDGKPDDYSDHYRGDYGIEDTRQALIEAHRSGIRPFCITIDHEAREYLPHLYGPVNWTLVDNVEQLPLKVGEIYRRLTA